MTTIISKEARHSSELSKHPAKVFAAAEHHPITVTRRDGEDLVLMTRRNAEQLAQLSDLAAQLFLATVNKEGSVEQRITNVFPWMTALAQAERQTCAQDILDATITSLATNHTVHSRNSIPKKIPQPRLQLENREMSSTALMNSRKSSVPDLERSKKELGRSCIHDRSRHSGAGKVHTGHPNQAK